MGAINALRCLHQLRKNQWLKTSELEELQNKKLRVIIKHAYENTDFYHKKFKDAGIRPEDIKNVEDLKKVPFTTKTELRNNLCSIIARGTDLKKCYITKTGGSTGIPMRVVYDGPADDFSKAVNLRSHIENGLHVRDKWVVLRDSRDGHHEPKKRWFQHLRIFSPMQVSIYESIDKQLSLLRDIKPDVLDGYSMSIRLLANTIENKGIRGVEPKVIFGTSELLDNNTRQYINKIFGVKMIDHFGCTELNRTAWECGEHTGYHIDVDAVVMEFIKNMENVSTGERGDIVYTGLYNFAMPLIRYNVGDIGVPTDELCTCGRNLPLMKVIEGRSDSFIQTIDGRIFSPIAIQSILEPFNYIKNFKIVQEKKDLIRVFIVGEDRYKDDISERVRSVFKQLGMNIELEFVDNIPREKSGKIRSVVSHVKVEW